MRLTCPSCGATHSLDALVADAAARRAVVAALGLPAGLGERLIRYLALFRPAKSALSWARVAALLEELNAAVAAAEIQRHGRAWPAPVDYWKQALDQMLEGRDRLSLPLKTHGYLYEILVGMSQKAEEKRLAHQEVADERARAREGTRTGAPVAAAALVPAVPAAPPPRPPRVPPPADFRALLGQLTGRRAAADPKPEFLETPNDGN